MLISRGYRVEVRGGGGLLGGGGRRYWAVAREFGRPFVAPARKSGFG
jgi:hypothetical protein